MSGEHKSELRYRKRMASKGARYRHIRRSEERRFKREAKLWKRRNDQRHIPLELLVPLVKKPWSTRP